MLDFDARGSDRDHLDPSGMKAIKNFADLKANYAQADGKDVVISVAET